MLHVRDIGKRCLTARWAAVYVGGAAAAISPPLPISEIERWPGLAARTMRFRHNGRRGGRCMTLSGLSLADVSRTRAFFDWPDEKLPARVAVRVLCIRVCFGGLIRLALWLQG